MRNDADIGLLSSRSSLLLSEMSARGAASSVLSSLVDGSNLGDDSVDSVLHLKSSLSLVLVVGRASRERKREGEAREEVSLSDASFFEKGEEGKER